VTSKKFPFLPFSIFCLQAKKAVFTFSNGGDEIFFFLPFLILLKSLQMMQNLTCCWNQFIATKCTCNLSDKRTCNLHGKCTYSLFFQILFSFTKA